MVTLVSHGGSCDILVSKITRVRFPFLVPTTNPKFLYTIVVRTQPKKYWDICDLSQWHKSSNDIISKVLNRNSPNHLQICSQLLLKAQHVTFVEWVFWQTIKIFLVKSFLGNCYRHLAIFFWSHWWWTCQLDREVR